MPLNRTLENGKNHMHTGANSYHGWVVWENYMFEVMFGESSLKEVIVSCRYEPRFPHSERGGKVTGKLWEVLSRL